MPKYRFRVQDRTRRVLAENAIVERDVVSACRAVSAAIAVFIASHGGEKGAVIELDDPEGTTVARLSLDGTAGRWAH